MQSNPSSPVILITGASAGIGAATARVLAKAGCRLALAARRKERLEDLAQELKSRHNTDALVLVVDLQQPDQVRTMVEAVVQKFGRIDVLINNAGVLRMAPLTEMAGNDLADLMNTNVWPVIHSIRAAVPFMAKQGGGHIINVASGVSRRGLPYMAAYSATKWAVAGLTEGLGIELAPKHNRFTTVYHGVIDTDMPRTLDRSRFPAEYPDLAGSRLPVERVAEAIARAVRRQPAEVYVPGWLRYAAWFCTICPAWVDRVILRHYRIRAGAAGH